MSDIECLITIGHKDFLKLIKCLNITGHLAKNTLEKRRMISVNIRLQKALRAGRFEVLIGLIEALAISNALEILYERPAIEIIKEAIYKKETEIKG
jgi:hypothetical protein